MSEILVWAKRILDFVPVFQDLWSSVAADNANQTFAAQLEMVRQIREAQAKERFGAG